jgi:16S rRNA processing protein RimM
LNASGHDLLAIGSIVKVFGIKGHVIVQPLSDLPSRFRTLKKALVGRAATDVREMRIESAVAGPRGVRLKIAGIDDRTSAEQLIGSLLFVGENERAKIPKGRYFIHDIVGLSVVDEQGVAQGRVREVMKMPAHDVYVIEGEGTEILLPAVKEFVLKIDLASRTMKVRLIEGMREGRG